MANKRVYQIEINGIKQSEDAIDSLLSKLKDLEKQSKIKVSSSASGSSKQQLTEEQKLQNQINKEIEKRKTLQSAQYQELLKEKQITKDIADEAKQISIGAKAEDSKQFTNTIAGLKAQLKELKAETQNIDLGDWTTGDDLDKLPQKLKDTNAEIKRITEQLKAFENSQGTFSRGVGDYYNEFKRALEDTNKEIEKSGLTLMGLKSQISVLQNLVNTTNVGTEEWKQYKQQLEEAQTQFKELTGTANDFIRAEDKLGTKLIVNLGDMTLEFDDLNQAIGVLEDKLYQLAASGKDNTEEFKNIQAEAVKLKKTLQDVDSQVDDLSQRGRGITTVVSAFESLTAAMQVGAGVAGLFGASQEKIEKSLNRIASLMSIAQGIQTIHNQLITKGTALNKLWTASMAASEKVIKVLTGSRKTDTSAIAANTTAITVGTTATKAATVATTAMSVASKAAAVSMRVLKVAIASTGIGLLVIAVGELVNKFMEWASTSDKLSSSLTSLKNSLASISSYRDLQLKMLENDVVNGYISNVTKLTKENKIYTESLNQTMKATKNLANSMEELISKDLEPNFWERNFPNIVGDSDNYFKFANEFAEATNSFSVDGIKSFYEKLNKEIDEGSGEAKDKLEAFNKAVAIQVAARLKFTDNENELKQQIGYIQEYITKIGDLDLDKTLNSEGLNDALSNIFNIYNDYLSNMSRINNEFTNISKQAESDRLESLEDGMKKEIAILNNRKNEELKALTINNRTDFTEEQLKKTNDARLAILAKYNKQENDIRKKYADEQYAIERQIEANKISIMNDSLTKRLKELELQYNQEIKQAKDSNVLVGEQVESINNKYNKLIIDSKKQYYTELENMMESYKNSVYKYENEIASLQLDNESINLQRNISISDNTSESNSYDVSSTFDKRIENERKYQEDRLKVVEEFNRLETELTIKQLNESSKLERQNEIDNYNSQLKVINDNVNKGLQTEKDAKSDIENITELHNQKMIEIENSYSTQLQTINNNSLNKLKENTSIALDGILSSFNDYFNDIQRLSNKATVTNDLGIINYSKTKENLDKIKKEYSNILSLIEKEYINLQNRLDNNEITFNNFKEAKKELDSLKQNTLDASQEVDKNFKNLFNNTVSSVNSFAQTYVSQLSSFITAWNDIITTQFDNEQYQLEQQAELIQKQLDKATEATQKYADKVNDIENELSSSRGDRRQALIDDLAAQREAQIAAMEEEQRLEAEKAKNEEKQAALEKKRKEAEKKVSIAQATISTATAITNALATPPWFVGVALAAVAAALGGVQIATIKSQKFADGGRLDGKSHSQGGIKIGNTGIEVEGGEYVVNKVSTKYNEGIIDYINKTKRPLTKHDLSYMFDNNINKSIKTKFAEGGELPTLGNQGNLKDIINNIGEQDDRPIVVSVVEIENVMRDVQNVRVLSGLNN